MVELNKAKNNLGIKGYMDANLAMIEKDQLAHTDNDVNIREAIAEQPQKDSMTAINVDKNVLSGTSYGASCKADTEMSPHYSETQRFAKDVPINEADYRKNLGNRQK